jgi:hypothetical protein
VFSVAGNGGADGWYFQLVFVPCRDINVRIKDSKNKTPVFYSWSPKDTGNTLGIQTSVVINLLAGEHYQAPKFKVVRTADGR